MNTISTIMHITAQARARVSDAPSVCWCGQDLECVRCDYCPRWGSAHVVRYDSRQTRLAG